MGAPTDNDVVKRLVRYLVNCCEHEMNQELEIWKNRPLGNNLNNHFRVSLRQRLEENCFQRRGEGLCMRKPQTPTNILVTVLVR